MSCRRDQQAGDALFFRPSRTEEPSGQSFGNGCCGAARRHRLRKLIAGSHAVPLKQEFSSPQNYPSYADESNEIATSCCHFATNPFSPCAMNALAVAVGQAQPSRRSARLACRAGYFRRSGGQPLPSCDLLPQPENTSSPSAASTRIVSPGPNSAARIFWARPFSSFCWMARLSGRAP